MEEEKKRIMACLAVAVAVLSGVVGQVRSDASDHRFKAGEDVPLYANKVGPFHNPRLFLQFGTLFLISLKSSTTSIMVLPQPTEHNVVVLVVGVLQTQAILMNNPAAVLVRTLICVSEPLFGTHNAVAILSMLCQLRQNHNARGAALQGNQEKGAELKKRPAMERDGHNSYEAKSDKGIENPHKKTKLNNSETETEQRIDDAQFQLSDSELVETFTYFEPSYLMIDKEAPRVQENLSMWEATWMDSTSTAWALEDAALETCEDLILDDFAIGAPLNIHDLLSALQSSKDLEPADNQSDFSRNSCLQCSEVLEQDPVSPLDVTLFPQLFGKSPQEQ